MPAQEPPVEGRPRAAVGVSGSQTGRVWKSSITPGELKNLAPLAQQRAQVGQRPQVPQLVRVDDRAHGLDLALRDVEGHHGDQPALAVEEERTRLPVYLLAARGDAEAGGSAPAPH